MNDLQEENPNYYAVIPAEVRYDNNLRDKAKLLYGEISSLCNKHGYCWASNSYFAKLYGVSITTISTLINELLMGGYIYREIIKKTGTKEIQGRKIYINPIKENLNTYLKKFKYPIKENLKDNNKNIIINNNNKENILKEKKFKAPTLEEIESYIKEKQLKLNGKDFYDYFTEGNWIDSKGNKVKNWKQKLLTWSNYKTSKKQESNFTSRQYQNLDDLFMN